MVDPQTTLTHVRDGNDPIHTSENGSLEDDTRNHEPFQKHVTFDSRDSSRNGQPSLFGASASRSFEERDAASARDVYLTENVGRHMRVPHQIRPYDDDAAHPVLQGRSFSVRGSATAHQMNVPDRILVAGNDQHMGFRDQRPRELDFDDMLYGFRTDVPNPLQTPPRTLTVGQHAFPSTGSDDDAAGDGPLIAPFFGSALAENNIEQAMIVQAERNISSGLKTPRSVVRRSNSTLATPGAVRAAVPDTPGGRLVVELYKRVESLERENYHRYLREMVGYAVLIGFVAMKGLSFFLKR